MIAQKQIITTEPVDIKITGITLLSVEEYEACKDVIPRAVSWWWLRSPSAHYVKYVAYVVYDGWVYDLNVDFGTGARPALQISNLASVNLSIGDKLMLAGRTWTVISGTLALCDDIVGETKFREDWKMPDANNYEKSDVKKWLENWARERGILEG